MNKFTGLLITSLLMSVWSFKLIGPSLFRTPISRCGVLCSTHMESARVSFSNLPYDLKEKELTDLIAKSSASHFKSLHLATDKRGFFSGNAVVEYDTKEAADAAIFALSTLIVHEKSVRVEMLDSAFADGNVRVKRASTNQTCFVSNLAYMTTEEDVKLLCDELVGRNMVKKISLVADRETGRPRGIGYIQFWRVDDAIRAVSLMSGKMLHGREISVEMARSDEDGPRAAGQGAPGADTKGASVFIGNLGWDVDEETLKEMLTDVVGAGTFQSVKLAVDKEGKRRGFAHVQFVDAATAEMAVRELDGLEMMDRVIRVDLSSSSDRKNADGGRIGYARER